MYVFREHTYCATECMYQYFLLLFYHFVFKNYFQFIKEGVLDELVVIQTVGSSGLISSSAYWVSNWVSYIAKKCILSSELASFFPVKVRLRIRPYESSAIFWRLKSKSCSIMSCIPV